MQYNIKDPYRLADREIAESDIIFLLREVDRALNLSVRAPNSRPCTIHSELAATCSKSIGTLSIIGRCLPPDINTQLIKKERAIVISQEIFVHTIYETGTYQCALETKPATMYAILSLFPNCSNDRGHIKLR